MPDPLRERLIAGALASSPSTLSFDRATIVLQTINSGKSDAERGTDRTNIVDSWNGSSWTLVSVDDKLPTADQASKYSKVANQQVVPGYHRLGNFLRNASSKSTDAQGRTVYHIESLPKGSVDYGGDVSDNMAADATVEAISGEPYVSRLHIYSKAPFLVALIFKVERFDSISDYKVDDDGKPVLTHSVDTSTSNISTLLTESTFSSTHSNEAH